MRYLIIRHLLRYRSGIKRHEQLFRIRITGCSKRPVSKAAVSEEARHTLSERSENKAEGLFQHPAPPYEEKVR